MLSIQTNYDSLMAQQNLLVNSQFQSKTIQRLTSGYRINSSGDDAAGLAIANTDRNNIAQLNQGVLNANNGISQLQIMDGGMSNIAQMLDRMQTLATEAASTTDAGALTTLDNEFQAIAGEIDREATNINMAGANTITVYTGGGTGANPSVTTTAVDSTGLGVNGQDLTTGAAAAITAVTAAVATLGTQQAAVGAGENVLTYAVNLAQSQISNLSSAQSQLRDANVAAEAANLTKAQVLQQAGIAAMAQANAEPQAVLTLLKQ
jgi:flagellin